MARDEGTFHARAKVIAIKEELAELKGMTAEMIKIKSLLKRFCSLDHEGTSIQPTTGEVSALAPVTAALGNNPNGVIGSGVFSDPVHVNTVNFPAAVKTGEDSTGVHFYIVPNTVTPIYTPTVRTTTHADVTYEDPNTQTQPVKGLQQHMASIGITIS